MLQLKLTSLRMIEQCREVIDWDIHRYIANHALPHEAIIELFNSTSSKFLSPSVSERKLSRAIRFLNGLFSLPDKAPALFAKFTFPEQVLSLAADLKLKVMVEFYLSCIRSILDIKMLQWDALGRKEKRSIAEIYSYLRDNSVDLGVYKETTFSLLDEMDKRFPELFSPGSTELLHRECPICSASHLDISQCKHGNSLVRCSRSMLPLVSLEFLRCVLCDSICLLPEEIPFVWLQSAYPKDLCHRCGHRLRRSYY